MAREDPRHSHMAAAAWLQRASLEALQFVAGFLKTPGFRGASSARAT